MVITRFILFPIVIRALQTCPRTECMCIIQICIMHFGTRYCITAYVHCTVGTVWRRTRLENRVYIPADRWRGRNRAARPKGMRARGEREVKEVRSRNNNNNTIIITAYFGICMTNALPFLIEVPAGTGVVTCAQYQRPRVRSRRTTLSDFGWVICIREKHFFFLKYLQSEY